MHEQARLISLDLLITNAILLIILTTGISTLLHEAVEELWQLWWLKAAAY